MRTIQLGHWHTFDINEYGQIVGARKKDKNWPEGLELRNNPHFVAALQRIVKLEDELKKSGK
jgi:hypothetical protein